MRKASMVLVLSLSVLGINCAQENTEDNNGINLYTFFVNVVNEQFLFPVIGFVNIAGGNHGSPQIGFINWNQKDFKTVQFGFVNTIGGGMDGLQAGFINAVVKSYTGVQFGFVNTAAGEAAGGLQLGFINTTVNKLNGAQISFVNITKQLNGAQIGFINYSESIEKGIPVGFLSIVRNGGYKAVELGVTEISPFNASFKIGVERLYTSFIVGYNPFRDGIREQIILGAGFGSIIQLGTLCYLNPEITSYNGMNEDFEHYVSIIPYFGYTIMPNLSIVIGPSVVWVYSDTDSGIPFFRIMEYSINDKNKLYIGARMALRFRW